MEKIAGEFMIIVSGVYFFRTICLKPSLYKRHSVSFLSDPLIISVP